MTAYGKDREVLRNMPSFRQLSGQFNASGRGRAPRGGPPYFIDQYKPPARQPDTIALIPGIYEHKVVDESGQEPVEVSFPLPYVEFIEHFDGKTQKSTICSAGAFRKYRDRRKPCNGCDILFATLEPGEDGKKRSTRMGRQSKCAFGIIDFSVYHNEPQFDDKGKPKGNPQTGKQYFNWVKCEGVGCDNCKKKLQTKFGHNPHWPMSWGHKESLRALASEVGTACASCRSIGSIRSSAWVCRECGELALNMEASEIKEEDLEKLVERYYTCQDAFDKGGRLVRKGCGKTALLKELIECSNCAYAERLAIYDISFKVKRIPTGNGNQSALNISSWSPLPKEGLARFLLSLVPQGMKAPTPSEIEALCAPKDLLKYFGPTPNKVQLDKFGPPPLQAPTEETFEPPPDADQSREYGEQYR